MRHFIILAVALICFSTLNAQKSDIKLQTKYGSDHKDLQDMLRFQDIETIRLTFTGEDLKGKNYKLFVKEYTNGSLSKTDTIMDSARFDYIPAINDSVFEFKYYVKTQIDNTIKMNFMFERFSTPRLYDIKAAKDKYALHDFLKTSDPMPIALETKTLIMGYFLPYIDKETGWKKYCDVTGSQHKPEDWGTVFNIPNYYLIEIIFE
ncbi:hypothetical protein [Psychroserpens luteolus]|uniref:hypothetical protein n=1 Tax=Psychroserpens luteolus TaxID=2855840 RepID=UPI001E62AEDE|nr:hypothetical protein [Psychroserpens luteolus]MCD2260002.1 hypothetical protein [Psychroserpens luteolus]